jgi:DNA-binding Lrp family transcriptional regulator
MMDAIDRRIVNGLQGGFPVCARPYAEAAARLGLEEAELMRRLGKLLDEGVLSRFGPMFHAERLGGGLTLAAMAVPEERFDAVTEIVNAFPEVAHNYARDHALNMWFVLATEHSERIPEVIAGIERETGLKVHDMPKIEEFFVGLRFEA